MEGRPGSRSPRGQCLWPADGQWPGASWAWLAEQPPPQCHRASEGSGVSLLWGKVRKAQVPEDVFFCSRTEKCLLQREGGP